MYSIYELILEVKSAILMLSAHPDNTKGSEFEDRIRGLKQAIEFLHWVEGNYTFDEYNDKREPLYVDLLDRFDENPKLFTIKQLYQKFKEEQK